VYKAVVEIPADVSEERVASVFIFEGKQERDLHESRKPFVYASTLMMEAICSPKRRLILLYVGISRKVDL
jgi:hypothetical protein